MEVPWGLPTAIGAFLITFGVAYVGYNILHAVARPFERHHFLLFQVAAEQFIVLGVIISALVLVYLPHRATPRSLGYVFPGWQTMALAASAIVIVILGVTVIAFIFSTFLPGYNLQGNANELFPGKRHTYPLVEEIGVFLWAAIEVPLAEETLFRGIMFQGLRQFFAKGAPYQVSVLLAAIASGAIFGLAHFEPHTLPILIFVGILLAYVFQFSRSVYGSAMVHCLINAIAVISQFHG